MTLNNLEKNLSRLLSGRNKEWLKMEEEKREKSTQTISPKKEQQIEEAVKIWERIEKGLDEKQMEELAREK